MLGRFPFHVAIICQFFFLSIQNVDVSANSPSDVLKAELQSFSLDRSLKNASWGFLVTDLQTGSELASINPDLSLIPASTQKVVTTLTALSLLGNDYRFETLLQHDGQIAGSVIDGNLIVRGTGDPTFGSRRLHDSLALDSVFASWLKVLREMGIKKIRGNIIGDGSAFDEHMVPPRWFWGHIGNAFGAGAHALTANENMYTVFFRAGKREGDSAVVVRVVPEIAGMEFINHVTTGKAGSGDGVIIFGPPYSNTRWLTGTVPLGANSFGVRGSMPDPGYFVASEFFRYLEENGIRIAGEALTHRNFNNMSSYSDRGTLSRWYSPNLSVIAARTNLQSLNTHAENIFKTLGREIAGEGTFANGSKVVTRFWNDKGIDTLGMRIHDGSGLSSFNTLTVRQLNKMLQITHQDTKMLNTLLKGFPVAGHSGTLYGMFRNTKSEGILMAKSGFLNNVLAFSGYTRCRDGRPVAFSIIVNNYTGSAPAMRRKIETLLNAIAL